MPNFILTKNSVIMCPHNGMVTHVPRTFTSYLVNGEPPLLIGDQYIVVGCANYLGGHPNPCHWVEWITGSLFLIVRGQPVLVHTSTGLCKAVNGAPQGMALPMSFQVVESEPSDITVIDY